MAEAGKPFADLEESKDIEIEVATIQELYDKLVCQGETNTKEETVAIVSVEQAIVDLGHATNVNVAKEVALTSEIERSLPQMFRESLFLQDKAKQVPSAGSYARLSGAIFGSPQPMLEASEVNTANMKMAAFVPQSPQHCAHTHSPFAPTTALLTTACASHCAPHFGSALQLLMTPCTLSHVACCTPARQ